MLQGLSFQMLAPARGLRQKLVLKHIPLRCAGRLTGHLWEQIQLPRLCRGGLLFCPGNTAPLRSLRSRQPVVVTIHDLSYRYFPEAYSAPFKKFYGVIIPEIFRLAQAVITVSASEKRSILDHYPFVKKRLHAIQNGGLGRRYLAEAGRTSVERQLDPPHLLYVGALNRRKNPQGVLQALEILRNDFDAKLCIAGSAGKSFQNTDFGVPEGLMKPVTFLGQMDDTGALIRLYKQAACFVFPSFYEASPLPPIEAMACGCPVVASDIPSLRERCGAAALFCNADDSGDIAKKITALLKNNFLREELVQKGRKQAAQFSWENCARQTATIIRQALSAASPQKP